MINFLTIMMMYMMLMMMVKMTLGEKKSITWRHCPLHIPPSHHIFSHLFFLLLSHFLLFSFPLQSFSRRSLLSQFCSLWGSTRKKLSSLEIRFPCCQLGSPFVFLAVFCNSLSHSLSSFLIS